MVPVSVTDTQGQPIPGLQIPDFHLEEEGKQQEIAEIGDPEQVPLDIAILFDISSSVSQKGFFAFQQNAAASFLRLVMKPVDKAAIYTIGSADAGSTACLCRDCSSQDGVHSCCHVFGTDGLLRYRYRGLEVFD
jgi:hypothetical protein